MTTFLVKSSFLFLALLGFAMRGLWRTYRLDLKSEEDITPLMVYWVGPSRWKTICNLVFLAVVVFFFPVEVLYSLTKMTSISLGLGFWVVLGFLSDTAMAQLFKRFQNHNGSSD